MKLPETPLFRDPLFDGAADPTLIWNHIEKQWWMVYTQRRATSPIEGISGVHGSELGVASSPDGHRWLYRGTMCGLAFEPGHNTWWAPEIVFYQGIYHMYVSYVQGIPSDWNWPRSILHYTSNNLWDWKIQSILPLGSERVIDACVVQLPGGVWRMWYKDEKDASYSHFADSENLFVWRPMGRAIILDHHEGPNVFWFQDMWWLIGDFWKGQGVFKSVDCHSWTFTGYLLDGTGCRTGDQGFGHHADVVVQNSEAYIFYFTHPYKNEEGASLPQTTIQVAQLQSDGKDLWCNRDDLFDFCLLPPANG